MSLFQEAVSLVGVAQVSRADNHVAYMLSQIAENGCRRVARGHIGLQRNGVPVELRQFAAQIAVKERCLVRICLAPLVLFSLAHSHYFLQLATAFQIQSLAFGEYLPRIFRVAA